MTVGVGVGVGVGMSDGGGLRRKGMATRRVGRAIISRTRSTITIFTMNRV